MKRKSIIIFLIIAALISQRCHDQEAVTPQTNSTGSAEGSAMLEKIKTLGFTNNQIREMSNYYLVDGDIYFPKKSDPSKLKPKPKRIVTEKYVTFNIRIDQSIAEDQSWVDGIIKAIEKWNADEDKHFHFALSISQDPDIILLKDNTLPDDVDVVADFPLHGRIGATIRINANAAQVKAQEPPEQTLSHALMHCAGFDHNPQVTHDLTAQNTISTSARAEGFAKMLYMIQGDWMYSRNMSTGELKRLGGGWQGSDAMTDCMTVIGVRYLFVVQFGYLYRIVPENMNHGDPLTGGWEGTLSMTKILGDIAPEKIQNANLYLYILQGGTLWKVNSANGEYLQMENTGKFSSAVSVVGCVQWNQPQIHVLIRNTIFGIGSLNAVAAINATSFGVSREVNVSPYQSSSFKGLAGGIGSYLERDGTVTLISQDRVYFVKNSIPSYPGYSVDGSSPLRFNNVTAIVSCDYKYTYIIDDGTLWEMTRGSSTLSQLGISGDWAGTKLMVAV